MKDSIQSQSNQEIASVLQISSQIIGQDFVKSVNARELHSFLEVGKMFAHWIKDRIEQYGFVEHSDYVVFAETGNNPSGGRPAKEYAISIDMAKELAMVERNEKGKQARQYFIDCEKKVKELIGDKVVVDPSELLSDPAAMRGLLLGYTEKVIKLQTQVQALAPKAEALDRIALADGSMCIRDAAKTLQVQESKLVKFLLERRWIYQRPMGAGKLAYSDKIQAGLMEHKITQGNKPDGSEWISTQARVTPKGLSQLSQSFGPLEDAA